MEWKKFWETDEMKDFTKKCLHNESMYDYKGSVKIIEDYWQESRDVNEFKRKVLDDERLSNNQGYWQLAKENKATYNALVYDYLESKADETFITTSDMGSLAVGTSNFRYNIPNLYGDGINLVYIINQNEHIEAVDFLTTIEGRFNIYNSDCGKSVVKTLEGRYAVYRGEKLFVFVKWND